MIMKQFFIRGVITISFQIGVNIIGLPDFWYHDLIVYASKSNRINKFSKV